MLDERLSGFSESHKLNACPTWQKGKQLNEAKCGVNSKPVDWWCGLDWFSV
jgi:hypothetical protein